MNPLMISMKFPLGDRNVVHCCISIQNATVGFRFLVGNKSAAGQKKAFADFQAPGEHPPADGKLGIPFARPYEV